MKKSKQTTLDFWKPAKPQTLSSSSSLTKHGNSSAASTVTIDLCDNDDDDDDEMLLAALDQEMGAEAAQPPSTSKGLFQNIIQHSTSNPPSQSRAEVAHCPNQDMSPDQILSTLPSTPRNVSCLPGFDTNAGRLWIYPTNYPIRKYQYTIVEQALFRNTMVVLPTGLGKTFVAAVVMYNFYLWYPQGKIIFMAPTKPLVAQQIEACYNVMGIPQEDMAEMTGVVLNEMSFLD
jgi:hypothetical protein